MHLSNVRTGRIASGICTSKRSFCHSGGTYMLNKPDCKAPRQPDVKQCGFFVMRYMKEIVEKVITSGSISLKSFFDKRKFPKDIDDVRVKWADYLLDEHM